MHTDHHDELISCIQKNAAQINSSTNQNQQYFNIEYTVRFSKGVFGSKRKIIYQTERSKAKKDAFWHSLMTEKDFLKCVKEQRKIFLFKNNYHGMHEVMMPLVNKLRDDYDKVSNYVEELSLLKAFVKIDWKKICIKNNSIFSDLIVQNIEKEWERFVKSWFGHTTNESFPFMKRTFNVDKAFGFDLGGDENQKKIYAVVQFFY